MGERVVFDPTNSNANIHGMVGENGGLTCLTQNSDVRCTGCCFALHITSTGTELGMVLKDAGEMCPNQIPQQGCAHVVNGVPENRFNPVCDSFHCSGQIVRFKRTDNIHTRQRLAMCNTASLCVGEITPEQYEANLVRIGI